MRPADYDFHLPPEQIAQRPADARSQSRMLVLGPGPSWSDHHASELVDLAADALIVINDSKVLPARIHVEREGDARRFELLLCAPDPAMEPGTVLSAWVRGAKRLRAGDRLRLADTGLLLRYLDPDPVDPRARRFELVAGALAPALDRAGEVPLPPYIAREGGPDEADRRRYQSVFAERGGSVAAPTAGLHFDEGMLEALKPARITLHVGPGTFLPMESEDVRAHRVGAERYTIDPENAARIEAARAAGRPILAVGTTVTRTLESVAAEHGGRIVAGSGVTDLVIVPGHHFRVVDRLMTNFHLPKSSLLMLTCTFGGRARVLGAYRHAVESGYRFYSYGDCMLIWPQEPGEGA